MLSCSGSSGLRDSCSSGAAAIQKNVTVSSVAVFFLLPVVVEFTVMMSLVV